VAPRVRLFPTFPDNQGQKNVVLFVDVISTLIIFRVTYYGGVLRPWTDWPALILTFHRATRIDYINALALKRNKIKGEKNKQNLTDFHFLEQMQLISIKVFATLQKCF
jgi:hypothetical protein